MTVSIGCTSALDCAAGEACCGSFQGGNAGPAVETICSATCGSDGPSVTLCASDAECATGETCQPGPFDVSLCQGQRGGGGLGGRGGFQGPGGMTGRGGRGGPGRNGG